VFPLSHCSGGSMMLLPHNGDGDEERDSKDDRDDEN
jgi:hypothetical protein